MNREQIGGGLYDFSRAYVLDADLIRCRHCTRGIIFSRRDEDMRHAADCPNVGLTTNPWKLLHRLTGPVDAERSE